MVATMDELSPIDLAFRENRLLAALAEDDRPMLLAEGTLIELHPGDIVLSRGESVQSSVFPIGKTMISMAAVLTGDRTVEVASVGSEGAVGGIVSCGSVSAFSRASVLIGGPALRVPMKALEAAKRESAFVGNLFCRYSDYLLSQVMQSVACNSFHSVQQRAARWLLHAQDRAGSRIELTQEALADMLGVQRTSVNAVIQSLVASGAIATGRGVIRVNDRSVLLAQSCECYRRVEDHFHETIRASGGAEI